MPRHQPRPQPRRATTTTSHATSHATTSDNHATTSDATTPRSATTRRPMPRPVPRPLPRDRRPTITADNRRRVPSHQATTSPERATTSPSDDDIRPPMPRHHARPLQSQRRHQPQPTTTKPRATTLHDATMPCKTSQPRRQSHSRRAQPHNAEHVIQSHANAATQRQRRPATTTQSTKATLNASHEMRRDATPDRLADQPEPHDATTSHAAATSQNHSLTTAIPLVTPTQSPTHDQQRRQHQTMPCR